MDVMGDADLEGLAFDESLFTISPSAEVEMPNAPASTATAPNGSVAPSTDAASSSLATNARSPASQPPPSKTDKPRPHLCTTCQRCFARLEHLKRHERSHTKEKPFECVHCKRCFARRDLLLRHQQKLHQNTTPAARPRVRRDSTTESAVGRARKNSVLSANDSGAAAGALNGSNGSGAITNGLGRPSGLNGLPGFTGPNVPNGGYGIVNGYGAGNGTNGVSGLSGFGVNGLGSSRFGANGLAGLANGLHGTNGLGFDGGMMRPRANTVSHVGAGNINPMSSVGASMAQGMPPGVHSRHPSLDLGHIGLDQILPLQSPPFVPLSAMDHHLPRLDTSSSNHGNFSGGVGTAPSPSFLDDFAFSPADTTSGSTINPSALHYTGPSHETTADASSAFSHRGSSIHDMHEGRHTTDSLTWLSNLRRQPSFGFIDENAVDTSSPSALSTDSHASDGALDSSLHLSHSNQIAMTQGPFLPHTATTMANGIAPTTGTTQTNGTTLTAGSVPFTTSMWQPGNQLSAGQSNVTNGLYLDPSSNSFFDFLTSLPLSPTGLTTTTASAAPQTTLDGDGSAPSGLPSSSVINLDVYFSTPPPSQSSFSPTIPTAMNPATLSLSTVAPSTPASMNGSNSGSRNRQRGLSTDALLSTITDATRAAIVAALNATGSQASLFSARRFSTNSPASPTSGDPSTMDQVPNTSDLQRYVGAYIRHFHPHFPFLHTATMSFDIVTPPALPGTNGNRTSNSAVPSNGCLLLCMAAIGALYETEHDRSRCLFNLAKRMIQLYLDERKRRNNARMRSQQQPSQDDPADTPLWLVQAMLLTVIYGHNSSDKRTGEIASTHCAALSSLTHGAELLRPVYVEPLLDDKDVLMSDETGITGSWATDGAARAAREEEQWLRWKAMEERKRTLYSVFVLMSLLMMSYNHTPSLTNSEIMLDLPCDEEFYAAPTCADFMALGGVAGAYHNRMSFHQVLGGLLRASEKQAMRNVNGSKAKDMFGQEPAPSTFGCFILINALHNYIWETRQRHHNKLWTNDETEKMHRHIEPALQAWKRAWARNAHHSAEQPHALATDALPMLDLAYVRLFVNLAPSKEKFWQRNWDGLAEELCHGNDIVQHAEHSPMTLTDATTGDNTSTDQLVDTQSLSIDATLPEGKTASLPNGGGPVQAPDAERARSSHAALRREKHLRKAAFFAVDALSALDKLGLPPTDVPDWKIALQPALCGLDCAQVLAEWVATLQDRVGPYLGILGHDDVELGQVPAIMLLEDDDVKLLDKIRRVLQKTEETLMADLDDSTPGSNNARVQPGEQIGYAAKILSASAYILGKAAVWPVTRLMAECLTNHAGHMRVRAEKSVVANSH